MAVHTDDFVVIPMDNAKYELSVVGKASNFEKPYLRLGDSNGGYLASLDPEEMYALRDALTKALRGWPKCP